jgi:hypothetical protein
MQVPHELAKQTITSKNITHKPKHVTAYPARNQTNKKKLSHSPEQQLSNN